MASSKDPWFRNRLIRDALVRAIYEEMQKNDAVYLLGEGAHMKVHFDAPEIERDFGGRVITLPISEDGNTNFAVGMSLAGLVPIVDVISSDFLYRTMDGICNTMAKAGTVGSRRTMVVRAEFLTGGPTSGQRVEALFAHVPGLRVAVPSNPDDAYGLMREALASNEVTIFFEDREIPDQGTPDKYRTGKMVDPRLARLVKRSKGRQGARNEVTVVSYGLSARRVEEALAEEDVTIVDLRTLFPLDVDTVFGCLGDALLVVEPDVKFLGIGAELVAQIVERSPGVVVKRLGGERKVIPASRELHEGLSPGREQILEAYRSLL